MRLVPVKIRDLLQMGLLVILGAMAVPMQAKGTDITWKITDWPPIYILEGPYAGQGAGDELLKFFAENLPEYGHKQSNMSITRFYQEARQGSRVCNVAGFPIEGVLASIPNSIILPHRVIMRKEKAHLLKSTDQVSLTELLNNQRLTVGLTRGRYGKLLNPIIDRHAKSAQIYDIPNYSNTVKMLFAGRIDYTIEYPPVIHYFEKLHEQHDEVLIIPIKELLDHAPYVVAHVICPQTQWGEEIISKVNRIIYKTRDSNRYREILLRWYDERTRRQVRLYLDEAFANKSP